MQKSKMATLIICILILIYALFSTFVLVHKINNIYLYIINPLFWIGFAVFLRANLGAKYRKIQKEKEITKFILIGVLIYIIVYLVSGLFLTFGKNPYLTTFKGLLRNLWTLGIPLILKEYVRYYLIQNVYDKDKTKIAVLISIIYIFIDMRFKTILANKWTPLYITKTTAQTILPLVAKNILYSYNAIHVGFIPNMCYEFLTRLYTWLSPILPNAPWIMSAIINSVIPVILVLYIRYEKNKSDYFKSRDKIERADPRSIIPLVICIILGIWFALGIFPIKPVAIATGSMKPTINIGDIAIIKKCNVNDVIVGDIIEYQMEGFTVIHRIAEKKQKNGDFYFVTKGDNNKSTDPKEVTEDQLIGKVIFKVKYLGYPAIWLNLIQEQETMEIETGY